MHGSTTFHSGVDLSMLAQQRVHPRFHAQSVRLNNDRYVMVICLNYLVQSGLTARIDRVKRQGLQVSGQARCCANVGLLAGCDECTDQQTTSSSVSTTPPFRFYPLAGMGVHV